MNRRDDSKRACNRDIDGYTADEEEYIRAVGAFQARTGARFPTATEYLEVAKALGYRKPEPPNGQ